MTDKPLTPEERLADWMLDHLAEYNRWMMTGWRETMRAVVLAGQMLDAARVAAPSDGLREPDPGGLREAVLLGAEDIIQGRVPSSVFVRKFAEDAAALAAATPTDD
jgi:hypothetical protein